MQGIYQIKNLINNKIYIGSTINFKKRKRHHFNSLKINKHHNYHLQYAYNKYGLNNFIFGIVEEIDNENKLIEREQYYIDILKPEYNISPTAGNILGYKHTKEAKEKIRKKLKGNKNFLGKNHTEKYKKFLFEINKKNMKPVLQINKNDGVVIKEWSSIKRVSKELNISRGCIMRCCKNERKTAGGFIWKYKNVEEIYD